MKGMFILYYILCLMIGVTLGVIIWIEKNKK